VPEVENNLKPRRHLLNSNHQQAKMLE